MSRFTLLTLLSIFAVPVLAEEATEITPEQQEFLEAKIRPILVNQCYECHATDAEDIEGGLVLDSRWGWQTGGDSGPAVMPGKPHDSLLIHAVRYEDDVASAMPPKSKLPAKDIALLEKWVEIGAADPRAKVEGTSNVESFDLQKRFEEHWSWRPIANPPLPHVNATDWPLVDFDRFVLAKLEAAKIKPAIPAEKRVWLRRVYFDLIGLPPQPSQIAAFLADDAPDAYQRVVQELLDSPHFGEKWARHWMDLVRYAETYGHEFDYPIPNASEYRNYLIRAFNQDVPYDQFVVEHIAGDLLASPRRHPTEQFNESVIGTGYWFLHEATHAPTDVLQNEADIIDNQLDVFGKAFLGLTVACARCHDHKFDAISTADYYALSAFIQSSCRQRYPLDPGQRIKQSISDMSKIADELRPEAMKQAASLKVDASWDRAVQLLELEAAHPSSQENRTETIDDFEDDYSRWQVTGDAFGERPATKSIPPQREVVGKSGHGFVSSYGGNDQKTGSLLSKPFTVSKPYIWLGVGGGKHKVGVEFRVGDQVIYTAHGQNREDLLPVSWDVKKYLGQQATIRIFDDNNGGWGHVNVDRIVLADRPGEATQRLPLPSDETTLAAAADAGLDAARLSKWMQVLAAGDPAAFPPTPQDVLTKQLLAAGKPAHAKQLNAMADRIAASLAKSADQANETTPFAVFDGETLPDGWTTTGFAFQPTHTKFHLSTGDGYIPNPQTVDSGVFGKRATGILRSPTFTIEHPNIHVLMRATENISMQVVIDNYQMAPYNGLLFQGTYLRGQQTDTKGQWQWKSFGGNLSKYIGHKAYLEFVDENEATIAIDQIFFSDNRTPAPPIDPLTLSFARQSMSDLWQQSQDNLQAGKVDELFHWLRKQELITDQDLVGQQLQPLSKFRTLAAELPQPRYVLAMAQGTRENAHVYVRGSHTMLGAEVPPRTLTALGGEQLSRLDLAKKLASEDNPLVARVIVNRLWHHLFGQGIVPTVDDFGPQGLPASHPELLDHLATQFMADGWSIKQALRRMVLSQTYRQASVVNSANDPDLIATTDPTNSLLYRMRVRRLPAESIRDAILAVSQRLDPQQFGGSVATYRTPFMTGRGARGSGPLDGAGRRSIYLSIYRNFLNPFLLSFDMPSPFGPKGRRSDSNVPAQALTLMNDPFVAEQARVWADKVIASESDPAAKIAAMVQRAHGQLPTQDQIQRFKRFVTEQLAANGNDQRQAWADLAHALYNMKAFYFLK